MFALLMLFLCVILGEVVCLGQGLGGWGGVVRLDSLF